MHSKNGMLAGTCGIAAATGMLFVLYASFAFNGLKLWDQPAFDGFQSDSESLVLHKIAAAGAEGVFANGGYLIQGGGEPYYSQTGLQGITFAFIRRLLTDRIGQPSLLHTGRSLMLDDGTIAMVNSVTYMEGWIHVRIQGRSLDPERHGFPHRAVVAVSNTQNLSLIPANLTDANWTNGIQNDGNVILIPYDGADPTFAAVMRHIVAFLFALLCVALIIRITREFGTPAGALLFLGILTSPWLTFFSRNLYWIIALHFAPFVLTWLWYERMRIDAKNPAFFAMIFLLILLKSLCGYEYLSNILSSVCVPIIYYSLSRKTPFRRVYLEITSVAAAGIAAFSLAVAIHLIQGYIVIGDLPSAFDKIFLRMTALTQLNEEFKSVGTWEVISGYLPLDAVLIPFINHSISIGFFIWTLPLLIIAALVASAWSSPVRSVLAHLSSPSRRTVCLAIASLFALLSSLTWPFLAKVHMAHHPHMNAIVFSLPFLLTYFMLAGSLFSDAMRGLRSLLPSHLLTSGSHPRPALGSPTRRRRQ